VTGPEASYAPRRPALVAWVVFVLAVLSLCWPMLGGDFLVGPRSDQFTAGYGFRLFGAEFFREHGRIPQWNPYLFGGMPYIAAMHGDIFYPTAWLRWIMPVDRAMTLGLALHLVLAGGFMYAFLRRLGTGWTAAVTGGVAYQLTGIVASLVQPGHDGKLFVSALTPLAFLALLAAIRERRPWGWGLFALVTGLGLLSPHYQLTYYLLVACGLWTLWLTFGDDRRPEGLKWPVPLGLGLLAVGLGVALSGLQAFPFLEYIPYSPRAAGGPSGGWEYATSFSMPVEELMTTVLPQFNGVLDQYWGRNFFKLHTEYLGAVVVVLAVLGAGDAERGRVRWGLGAVALLFLFISFGRHTPVYRLWYEVMPLMKKVRAPGMAFFLPAFVVAAYAAFGVDRLLARRVRMGTVLGVAAVPAAIAALGAAGALQPLAEALARPEMLEQAIRNADALREGAIRLLGVTLLGAAVLWAVAAGRIAGVAASAALVLVVTLDLWSVDRRFFTFSPPAARLYADDEITTRLRGEMPAGTDGRQPFRVLDLPGASGVYEGSWLMAHRIPGVFGYHGNEVRFYDELWGGKNEWRNIGSPSLWELWAVRYVVLREEQAIPGYRKVLGPVATTPGGTAVLYERETDAPWARLVPGALKLKDDEALQALPDPRFPVGSVVVLSDTASVNPTPLAPGAMPPAPRVTARVTRWEPGAMTIALEGRDERTLYLTVAETWYPDWKATVDGAAAPVLRANHAMVGVAVPPGAREVRLEFRSARYAQGKLVSGAALLAILGLVVGPMAAARRRADG